MVRVDVELPVRGSRGNVHVQVKGPGNPGKYYLGGPKDLSTLPRGIRDDPDIARWVRHAFDLLERSR